MGQGASGEGDFTEPRHCDVCDKMTFAVKMTRIFLALHSRPDPLGLDLLHITWMTHAALSHQKKN
jgi:hypothetical protein